MSSVAAMLRKAGELLVEPAAAEPAPGAPLDVTVTALSSGAGATTVARGLAVALGRARAVELAHGAADVTAGPGMTVVRETGGVDARPQRRGVLIAVADGRREPALAVLVAEVLARRHDHVVLVANRARDVGAWSRQGAICVPDSRAGAWLLAHGRRPPGAIGAAFEALAAELR